MYKERVWVKDRSRDLRSNKNKLMYQERAWIKNNKKDSEIEDGEIKDDLYQDTDGDSEPKEPAYINIKDNADLGDAQKNNQGQSSTETYHETLTKQDHHTASEDKGTINQSQKTDAIESQTDEQSKSNSATAHHRTMCSFCVA